MSKILDPSDINNVVNGFDVHECCTIREGTLIVVMPNYGYGFLANMMAISNSSFLRTVEPGTDYSYTTQTYQGQDADEANQVRYLGTKVFAPLDGAGRDMFTSCMDVNSTCARSMDFKTPFALPMPVKIVPREETEGTDRVRQSNEAGSRQYALFSAAAQISDGSSDMDLSLASREAISSEIFRSVSDMLNHLSNASEDESTQSARSDPSKWTGTRNAEDRIEFVHLFDELTNENHESVFTKRGPAKWGETFLRPSALLLTDIGNGMRLYYSEELSEALFRVMKIYGKGTAPMLEYAQTVHLCELTDTSSVPLWVSAVTEESALSYGISRKEYRIIAGTNRAKGSELFDPELINTFESIRTYNYENGSVTDHTVSLLNTRPPSFAGGELLIDRDGEPFLPFSAKYIFPAVIETQSSSEVATCGICGGDHAVGYEKCPYCLDEPGWIVCPSCKGSKGIKLFEGQGADRTVAQTVYCERCNENGEGENPGKIPCTHCDGTGEGWTEECPSCGETGTSYKTACGTCHNRIEEVDIASVNMTEPQREDEVRVQYVDPNTPDSGVASEALDTRYVEDYERSEFTITLASPLSRPNVVIYLDDALIPNTVKLKDGEIITLYTLSGNTITVHYPVMINGTMNSLLSRLTVYEADSDIYSCNECAITVDDWTVYPAFVFSATDIAIPPSSKRILTDLSDIRGYMYKDPDEAEDNGDSISRGTIPYHEGFCHLGSGMSYYRQMLESASLTAKRIASTVITGEDEWASLQIHEGDDRKVDSARVCLPRSSSEAASDWNGFYEYVWNPTTSSDDSLSRSFWAEADTGSNPILIGDSITIGEVVPSRLGSFSPFRDTSHESAEDYLDALCSASMDAGNVIDIDENTLFAPMTMQEATKLTANSSESDVIAGAGATIEKVQSIVSSGNEDSINPILNPITITADNDAKFTFGEIFASLVNFPPGDRLEAVEELMTAIPGAIGTLKSLVENTVLAKTSAGLNPEPLWMSGESITYTSGSVDIMDTLESLEAGLIEQELSSEAAAADSTAATMNATFSKGMKKIRDAVNESADLGTVNIELCTLFSNLYEHMCRIERDLIGREGTINTLYYVEYDAPGGSRTGYGLINVSDTYAKCGYWYYNLRKLYMLYLSGTSLVKALCSRIIAVLVSLRCRFLPSVYKKKSDTIVTENGDVSTSELSTAFEVYGFASGADGTSACYPILDEDITLTSEIKNQQIEINKIQDAFEDLTLYYDIRGELPDITDISLKPVPIFGLGAVSDTDFSDDNKVYWIERGLFLDESVQSELELDSTNESFDTIRAVFSKFDYMAFEDGSLKHMNATGTGTTTRAFTDHGILKSSIESGLSGSFTRVSGKKFTGKVDFSGIFPYLHDVRPQHPSAQRLSVMFEPGEPEEITMAQLDMETAEEWRGFLGNHLTEPTSLGLLQLDALAIEIREHIVREDVVEALTASGVHFLIPFMGLADPGTLGYLNAYLLHQLGYQLKPEFLDSGSVSTAGVAAKLKSSGWKDKISDQLDEEYALFLSKRRAFAIASYVTAKLVEDSTQNPERWQAGEKQIAFTKSPPPGSTAIDNPIVAYGFGSMFANAFHGADDMDGESETIKEQRSVFTILHLPTTGRWQGTQFTGRGLQGSVSAGSAVCNTTPYPCHIAGNSQLLPVWDERAEELRTYLRYVSDPNENWTRMEATFARIKAMLLPDGEPARSGYTKISIDDYIKGHEDIKRTVRTQVARFLTQSFIQGHDAEGAFKVPLPGDTLLDKVKLTIT